MNYFYTSFIILIFSTGIYFSLSLIDGLHANSQYGECFARCEKLTGQGKYNCIKICLKTIKKKDYGKSKNVKKKIEECKDICSVYSGIENVKCLRICLEKNTSMTSGSKDTYKVDPKTKECEERCSFLTGSTKYKCIKKCLNLE